jgi:hypothetical protein
MRPNLCQQAGWGSIEEEEEVLFKLTLFTSLMFKSTTQRQGCQIFLGTIYQNGKNIPK